MVAEPGVPLWGHYCLVECLPLAAGQEHICDVGHPLHGSSLLARVFLTTEG